MEYNHGFPVGTPENGHISLTAYAGTPGRVESGDVGRRGYA
jgi:hypothetical protein